MKLQITDLGMQRAGEVFWTSLPPQCNLDKFRSRTKQDMLGAKVWGPWWGGEGGRGSQAPLTPAFPPTFPLQAQTRAALLRVLQENEEYWGSTEDRPSSLAQDVCEVGGGEEEGESAGTVPGWESRTSPLLTPSPLHGPQLLEEHTERAPRISQEFGERMAHCCLGGLAEFLQRYVGRGGGRGTGLGWGGISTQDPKERGEMEGNQVRKGRGASVRITGFAGPGAQPETLLQR